MAESKKNRFKHEPLLEFKVLMPKQMFRLAEKKADTFHEGNKCAYGRKIFMRDLNCDEHGNELKS